MDHKHFRLTPALFLAATGLLLTAVLAATGLLLTAGAESEHQVTSICEQGNHWNRLVHRLECGRGVISVKDSRFCTPTDDDAAACMNPQTSRNVKPRCDGRKSCELYTTDFCNSGTQLRRYLQTTFTCVEALTVVACEDSTARLDCGLGHVIAIYGAAYGRRDMTTCSFGIDPNELSITCMQPATGLGMQPAAALVAQMCNGQSNCSVRASSAVFTDPCVGTYKFLEISYGCQRAESEHQVMTVCDQEDSWATIVHRFDESEHQVMTVCDQEDSWATIVHRFECDRGVIRVKDSVYGHSNSRDCAKGESDPELAGTQCILPGAVDKVKLSCDGRKSCELYMTGFCTPGPHVGEYLQTTFTCVEALTVVACEESTARLDCGLGRAIAIYGAAYGRRDMTTCSFGLDTRYLRNVDCMQPTATALVAQMCNGQSSCSVRATSEVFTDPCVGTYKYLEISYGCQRK